MVLIYLHLYLYVYIFVVAVYEDVSGEKAKKTPSFLKLLVLLHMAKMGVPVFKSYSRNRLCGDSANLLGCTNNAGSSGKQQVGENETETSEEWHNAIFSVNSCEIQGKCSPLLPSSNFLQSIS